MPFAADSCFSPPAWECVAHRNLASRLVKDLIYDTPADARSVATHRTSWRISPTVGHQIAATLYPPHATTALTFQPVHAIHGIT